MKVPLLLLGFLWAVSAVAQGTYLYTWHGNSGFFQASFQVAADQNQPGEYFDIGPFVSTFNVVSPDDVFTDADSFSGEDGSGFGPPLKLSVSIKDYASGRAVDVVSNNGFSLIGEYVISDSNSILWRESGYWTYAPVPEPSTAALLLLGGLAWIVRAGTHPGPNFKKSY